MKEFSKEVQVVLGSLMYFNESVGRDTKTKVITEGDQDIDFILETKDKSLVILTNKKYFKKYVKKQKDKIKNYDVIYDIKKQRFFI